MQIEVVIHCDGRSSAHPVELSESHPVMIGNGTRAAIQLPGVVGTLTLHLNRGGIVARASRGLFASVNGQPLIGATALEELDVVGLGRYKLQLQARPEDLCEEATVPRARFVCSPSPFRPTFDEVPTRVVAASALTEAATEERTNDDHQGEEDGPADVVDVEDDGDEDEVFEEPFSLLENVVRERFRAPCVEVESFRAIEVIHYRDGEILDLLRADPGQSLRVGSDQFRLLTLRGGGKATLHFRTGFGGTVVTGGKARRLKRLCSDRFRCSDLDPQHFAVSLTAGDFAQILRGNDGYLVRFVRPPTQPAARWLPRVSWGQLQMVAASAAAHLLVLVLLGFTSQEANLSVAGELETFARAGSYELPRLESKPAQPKLVEPPPQAPQAPSTVEKSRRRPHKAKAHPAAGGRSSAASQQRQVRQVYKALENLRPSSGTPGRSDLGALTSNIVATRSPSAGYKISGVMGKLGGGRIQLGGGGRPGSDTRTIGQLLTGRSGGTGTLVVARDTGYRGPLGMVKRQPKRIITVDGGDLDKAKIQRVVNQHMHEIQRCYEVQLLGNPGLQGRMVVDWTISPNGSVTLARLVTSSIPSPALAGCVLARIRTWRFPSPTGGSVKVRYPFVFRARGF